VPHLEPRKSIILEPSKQAPSHIQNSVCGLRIVLFPDHLYAALVHASRLSREQLNHFPNSLLYNTVEACEEGGNHVNLVDVVPACHLRLSPMVFDLYRYVCLVDEPYNVATVSSCSFGTTFALCTRSRN